MTYTSPILETTLKLLNYLKENSHTQKSLAEACKALGIPRSTAFTIMKTLVKYAFVNFDDESKRYSLGWALVEFGVRASEQMTYVELLRPYLRSLGRDTDLTCHLVQRAADVLVIADKVEPQSDIRVAAPIGKAYPLTASAPGKVLMAYLEEQEILSYLAREGLPTYTPYSVTDVKAFLRDLVEVRRLGYAKSLEEFTKGVNVVAAPIFDASGNANLTLALLGPTPFLPSERVDQFGRKVLGAARQMTSALGGIWRGPE